MGITISTDGTMAVVKGTNLSGAEENYRFKSGCCINSCRVNCRWHNCLWIKTLKSWVL